ncbi:type 4a pilus biogenesis protein PilO [Gemmatimonadota bacterium]
MSVDLSDQKTQLILVIVLAAAGALYAWFTYIYTPKNEAIVELQTEIETFENEIQRFQIEANQAGEVEAQLAEAQRQWTMILTQFPTEMREDEILANMTSAEGTSNLFLVEFTRGDRRTQELYIEQDYNIRLLGEFRRLGSYIADLASMPRRMSVSRMQITHPSAAAGAGGGSAGPIPTDDEIIIQLIITTYIVRER